MNIPLMNLKAGFDCYYDEVMAKLKNLIDNTQFIGGEEITLFEQEFAEYCNLNFAVGCSNGTAAIEIALKSLSIGVGDKVIVPTNSFIATAEAVSNVGAEVVFADIEEDYYTISPNHIEQILLNDKESKVRAIIPVHLYGQIADMPRIMELAKKYKLKVIEDSAQAHGSELDGKRPGEHGDIATFSFFPGKNLGAFGDAGALVTNNKEIYNFCKTYVNHGRKPGQKYTHDRIGANNRIDTLQAAVLRIKLKHLEKWTAMRRENATFYTELLNGKGVVIPKIRKGANPAWHLFVIRVERRKKLQEFLKSKGITTNIHYPIPLHKQPAYNDYCLQQLPISENQAAQVLSLPFWPEMSKKEIEFVCNSVIEFS